MILKTVTLVVHDLRVGPINTPNESHSQIEIRIHYDESLWFTAKSGYHMASPSLAYDKALVRHVLCCFRRLEDVK
jgi:hypothetical protein